MRTTTVLTALAILSTLTACDYAARRDLSEERESRSYRAAMADYRAGRIDAAISGFEKTIREEPANAGARFQYACLLQDSGRDCLGAFCAYHEYISQHPESDKAQIAAKRMAVCEKELAGILAEKHGIARGAAREKEFEALKAEAESLRKRAAEAEKGVEACHRRIAALVAERARLVALVKGVGDGAAQSPDEPSAKDVKALLEEDDSPSGERAEISSAVAKLRDEEKYELDTGSSLLPARKPEDVARRDAAEAEKAKAREEAMRAAAARRHPATYVVQEGDTLYSIAARFYGRLSAWKRIRDANKAVISNDGRVRAGDKITLPD